MGYGFIDHLYTRLGTTSNYNTTADFHTINHSMLSSQPAFSSRCLVKALNDGCSSAVLSLDVSW
jgi:hypothetical protein